jgi:hypothetical protein
MSVVIRWVRDDPTMPTKRLRYVTRLTRATSSGAATVRSMCFRMRCARQCGLLRCVPAMWKDHVKDDGMAKGATKMDETMKSTSFFVHRRVE